MTPNKGRLDAKFLVPSIGSTMKANSASAMVWSSAGSLCVPSSPMTTLRGNANFNAAVIAASAASSASVTRSNQARCFQAMGIALKAQALAERT